MEPQNQSNPSSGDMDLGSFLSGIGKFFSTQFSAFVKGLARIRRVTLEHRIMFIVLIVTGIIGGTLYSKFIKKNFYESTMIVNMEYMNKRTLENAINNLNLLVAEESKVGLSKALNIKDSLAQNIVEFEGKPIIGEEDIVELQVLKEQLKNSKLELENPKVIDEVIKRLEIENRHAFEIKVKVYNPHQFKGLEDALVQFFKSNEYVKKRIEINHRNLEAKRNKLKNEMEKLDSLKQVLYANFKTMAEQKREGSNNVIMSEKLIDKPIELFTQTSRFWDDYEELNKDLYLRPDFEVVDGFAELNVPSSAGLVKINLIALLIAVGAGYVIIGWRKLNEHLNTLA